MDFSQANEDLFNNIVSAVKQENAIDIDFHIKDFEPVGVRACFRAPGNHYIVDADYATAEVFSIAYLANDKGLINTLTQPDPQFGLKLIKGKEVPVRIAYKDEIVPLTDDAKDKSLLTDINDPDLLRDEQGNLRHPKQDVHWAACENKYFLNTPREKLDKNKTRDAAGKVANFCSCKDNLVLTKDEGYIHAEDVAVGSYLQNKDGYTKVLNKVVLHNQDCLKLTFDSGLSANYHKMHKLRVWNGHKLSWVRVKDLKPSDQVITFRNKVCNVPYKPKLIGLKDSTLKPNSPSGKLSIDINSNEFAYLAGLYLGSGSHTINRSTAKIYQPVYKKYNNEFITAVKKLGLNATVYKLKDLEYDNTIEYCGYDTIGFSEYLISIFGDRNSKTLPDFIMSSWSKDTLQQLLIGLSHTCMYNSYKFINASKLVINKIALIANYLGYKTRLLKRKTSSSAYVLKLFKKDSRNTKTEWYPAKLISSEPYKDTIIALECEAPHEYIDTAMNSHNSIPYGASPDLLERQIEVATGEKPTPGTGEKLIKGYMETKPQVADFINRCHKMVSDPGYYQAPSGYKRHYKTPDVESTLNEFYKKKLIGALERQASNVPLQNLVADSLARAIYTLNKDLRAKGLRTRCVLPLYDAIYMEAPADEIILAKNLLRWHMSTNNYWDLPGGRLAFNIDVEVTKATGTKMSKEEDTKLKEYLKF